MLVMQIAPKFCDQDWLVWRQFRQSGINLAHFKAKAFGPISCYRCRRPIRAKCNPIAIGFAREIVFERIPFSLWFIEPVYVPHPLQVAGTFAPYQVNDVTVGRYVFSRAFLRSAIPFPIPAKPFSVRFRPPFDQNRRSKIFCFARPDSKIVIEIPGDDLF